MKQSYLFRLLIPCLNIVALILGPLNFANGAGVPKFDVAVIGSGPAGLAASIGIRRAMGDISLAVFERSSELREVGGQVGLISPAFNALKVRLKRKNIVGKFRYTKEISHCSKGP
jgi:ribulose 1,5-bisphosphate synthetase/thiazole synthase